MIKKRIFYTKEKQEGHNDNDFTIHFFVEYRILGVLIYVSKIEYKKEYSQQSHFALSELFQLL